MGNITEQKVSLNNDCNPFGIYWAGIIENSFFSRTQLIFARRKKILPEVKNVSAAETQVSIAAEVPNKK